MSKNNQLNNILCDQEQLKGKDKALRDNALDAIIQADPANAGQFRKALTDHHAFWSSFLGLMNAGNQPDYFKSEHFLDPAATIKFATLQQLAAKQRVSLGLTLVPDEVLIKLLANNHDECRNYLNSKPAVSQLGDLTRAHGWSAPAANPPHPKMKFGQDAIQVVSRTFKPESEMQSLLVTKRFKSDSLYKTAFNSGKDIVADIIEDATTLSKNRINSLAVADKADSAMMQANKDFKSAMKDTLAQAKDNKEREGPAPETDPDSTNRFGV